MEEVLGNSNLFSRPWVGMAKGQVIQGHAHNWDHTTYVLEGSVRVRAKLPDGSQIVRDFGRNTELGLRKFVTRAGVEHEIEALEDGTHIECVYAHRTPQGDVVQHYTGWGPAYL